MRKTIFLSLFLCCIGTTAFAQGSVKQEKEVYIPNDLKGNDFSSNDSQWSWERTASTDDIILFWEKGFGNDLAKAPNLEGKPMTVDKANLLGRLQQFYDFYRDSLKFVLPGSKSERLKMMVMLNYSLEGTAYGGDYDGEIGALWIAPNRVQDKKLNAIAHELGHSFQSQVSCDGAGQAWGGGGIFEMTSQWMLWQVNPEWVHDEQYHWDAFCKLFHKRFLAGENIYHSPYVLEYWSMKRGKTVMGDMFRAGKHGEDPLMTYRRMFNLSWEEVADELYDCYARLITFDDPRVKDICKAYACQLQTPMVDAAKGSRRALSPDKEFVPETFGFNVVELPLECRKIQFIGQGDKKVDGYRWGVVCVKNGNQVTYLPMQTAAKKNFRYDVPAGTEHVYLVVMGYPKNDYKPMGGNPYEPNQATEKTYPYTVVLK